MMYKIYKPKVEIVLHCISDCFAGISNLNPSVTQRQGWGFA